MNESKRFKQFNYSFLPEMVILKSLSVKKRCHTVTIVDCFWMISQRQQQDIPDLEWQSKIYSLAAHFAVDKLLLSTIMNEELPVLTLFISSPSVR
jgi:hypothetical protein